MKSARITRPLFLCGMMGAGKTTVGKILAEKTGLPFYDLDRLIEESEKKTIPEIFETQGEEYFRKAERKLLLEKSGTIKGIFALGGGALQNQMITEHLKNHGYLIYLKAPVKDLTERLQSGKGRPLLNDNVNSGIGDKLEQLLRDRTLFYEQSHITINTQNSTPGEVADQILQKTELI